MSARRSRVFNSSATTLSFSNRGANASRRIVLPETDDNVFAAPAYRSPPRYTAVRNTDRSSAAARTAAGIKKKVRVRTADLKNNSSSTTRNVRGSSGGGRFNSRLAPRKNNQLHCNDLRWTLSPRKRVSSTTPVIKISKPTNVSSRQRSQTYKHAHTTAHRVVLDSLASTKSKSPFAASPPRRSRRPDVHESDSQRRGSNGEEPSTSAAALQQVPIGGRNSRRFVSRRSQVAASNSRRFRSRSGSFKNHSPSPRITRAAPSAAERRTMAILESKRLRRNEMKFVRRKGARFGSNPVRRPSDHGKPATFLLSSTPSLCVDSKGDQREVEHEVHKVKDAGQKLSLEVKETADATTSVVSTTTSGSVVEKKPDRWLQKSTCKISVTPLSRDKFQTSNWFCIAAPGPRAPQPEEPSQLDSEKVEQVANSLTKPLEERLQRQRQLRQRKFADSDDEDNAKEHHTNSLQETEKSAEDVVFGESDNSDFGSDSEESLKSMHSIACGGDDNDEGSVIVFKPTPSSSASLQTPIVTLTQSTSCESEIPSSLPQSTVLQNAPSLYIFSLPPAPQPPPLPTRLAGGLSISLQLPQIPIVESSSISRAMQSSISHLSTMEAPFASSVSTSPTASFAATNAITTRVEDLSDVVQQYERSTDAAAEQPATVEACAVYIKNSLVASTSSDDAVSPITSFLEHNEEGKGAVQVCRITTTAESPEIHKNDRGGDNDVVKKESKSHSAVLTEAHHRRISTDSSSRHDRRATSPSKSSQINRKAGADRKESAPPHRRDSSKDERNVLNAAAVHRSVSRTGDTRRNKIASSTEAKPTTQTSSSAKGVARRSSSSRDEPCHRNREREQRDKERDRELKEKFMKTKEQHDRCRDRHKDHAPRVDRTKTSERSHDKRERSADGFAHHKVSESRSSDSLKRKITADSDRRRDKKVLSSSRAHAEEQEEERRRLEAEEEARKAALKKQNFLSSMLNMLDAAVVPSRRDSSDAVTASSGIAATTTPMDGDAHKSRASKREAKRMDFACRRRDSFLADKMPPTSTSGVKTSSFLSTHRTTHENSNTSCSSSSSATSTSESTSSYTHDNVQGGHVEKSISEEHLSAVSQTTALSPPRISSSRLKSTASNSVDEIDLMDEALADVCDDVQLLDEARGSEEYDPEVSTINAPYKLIASYTCDPLLFESIVSNPPNEGSNIRGATLEEELARQNSEKKSTVLSALPNEEIDAVSPVSEELLNTERSACAAANVGASVWPSSWKEYKAMMAVEAEAPSVCSVKTKAAVEEVRAAALLHETGVAMEAATIAPNACDTAAEAIFSDVADGSSHTIMPRSSISPLKLENVNDSVDGNILAAIHQTEIQELVAEKSSKERLGQHKSELLGDEKLMHKEAKPRRLKRPALESFDEKECISESSKSTPLRGVVDASTKHKDFLDSMVAGLLFPTSSGAAKKGGSSASADKLFLASRPDPIAAIAIQQGKEKQLEHTNDELLTRDTVYATIVVADRSSSSAHKIEKSEVEANDTESVQPGPSAQLNSVVEHSAVLPAHSETSSVAETPCISVEQQATEVGHSTKEKLSPFKSLPIPLLIPSGPIPPPKAADSETTTAIRVIPPPISTERCSETSSELELSASTDDSDYERLLKKATARDRMIKNAQTMSKKQKVKKSALKRRSKDCAELSKSPKMRRVSAGSGKQKTPKKSKNKFKPFCGDKRVVGESMTTWMYRIGQICKPHVRGFYSMRKLDKEEYKDVMRQCVAKLSRSNEISIDDVLKVTSKMVDSVLKKRPSPSISSPTSSSDSSCAEEENESNDCISAATSANDSNASSNDAEADELSSASSSSDEAVSKTSKKIRKGGKLGVKRTGSIERHKKRKRMKSATGIAHGSKRKEMVNMETATD